jgi:hypothetical protein
MNDSPQRCIRHNKPLLSFESRRLALSQRIRSINSGISSKESSQMVFDLLYAECEREQEPGCAQKQKAGIDHYMRDV